MNNNSSSSETPKTKLTYLKDGRVQITFKNFDTEKLVELPGHIYAIFRGFLLLEKHDMTQSHIDGLFAVINIAEELLPDIVDTTHAIREHSHRA